VTVRHPAVLIATTVVVTLATLVGVGQLAGGAPETARPGWALVGAAKTSLEPRPEDYGGTWERDRGACERMDPAALAEIAGNSDQRDHLADAGSPWPENSNCIYMGGFGLGPANPVTDWDDEYGLWVRSVAIGDGEDTVVLTILDGEGYFWDYASKCGDCGVKQLSAELGQELGIDPSGIPSVGSGRRLERTDVRTARTTWLQPVTNAPLTALGAPGFFDRQFAPGPSSVRTGKSPDTAPCASASANSGEVAAGVVRIGDEFALTTAPGEIFSNLSNTLKEKSGARVTMPLAQMNDALGYMPQQFELNEVGQQGLGFVVDGVAVVNYEDAYSIDRCFGDAALEKTIDLLAE
jgi:hypothetical protein